MPSRDLLTGELTQPLVAASILSADFARLYEECAHVLDAGADLLHLDVMDGHFVPNLTMGPALCASLRAALPDAVLDVHLMVMKPAMYVEPFAEAGADHFTFHAEVVPPQARPEIIRMIHDHGMTAGIAINPPTNIEALGDIVPDVDMVLVMSVNPGFSGQAFIETVVEKIDVIRDWLGDDQRLEVDGGVNRRTAGACRLAGADVLVAASAIFKSDDYGSAIEALRGSDTAVTEGR